MTEMEEEKMIYSKKEYDVKRFYIRNVKGKQVYCFNFDAEKFLSKKPVYIDCVEKGITVASLFLGIDTTFTVKKQINRITILENETEINITISY